MLYAPFCVCTYLDYHSSPGTVPNRFEFVFTPKHASWLNIIESFFAKMTKSVLRHIRVSSKEELRERIPLQHVSRTNRG